MLKATVRKTKWGYKGIVQCMNRAKIIWTENAGIERPSRKDALEDAFRRKADREATRKGNNPNKPTGTEKTSVLECPVCGNELIYSGDLAAPGYGQNYFCPECKNEYWFCQGRLTNWKHVDKDIFERIELFI
jgi:predicted RNA-binding Zn-ribbon protein involved in translation (DUF1610 family)